jgi:protoporphyrin/coproporphyrin ferrochelatase
VPEPLGLLVMAYGTATDQDDVERYYTDIRGGKAPAPDALQELKDRYAAIGNTFPLNRITEEQARALETELGGVFKTYVGMKHSPPFVPDAVARMQADGIREAVGLVLAPHYSRMSVGGYIDRVKKAAIDGPAFSFIEQWYDHPYFVEVVADRVRAARDQLTEDERANDLVVFTAHSLPTKILESGDPYPAQLQGSADMVAGKLSLDRYRIGWQSAGRTPEPWIGPPLVEIIRRAATEGHTAVVVCPVGFVADHLEVLFDVDIEAREAAAQAGIRLVRTASMNADPDFIRSLAQVVRDHLASREGG